MNNTCPVWVSVSYNVNYLGINYRDNVPSNSSRGQSIFLHVLFKNLCEKYINIIVSAGWMLLYSIKSSLERRNDRRYNHANGLYWG